jgi:hypothetical protein
MLVFLEHLAPAEPAPAKAPAPVETSRVTVDALTTDVVTLRRKGKEAKLSRRSREFFLALFWVDRKMVTFRDLWEKLVGVKTGRAYRQDPKGGGPPELLRKIKSTLNKQITKGLGRPPVGEFWIEAVEREGYRLNRASLVWQEAMGALHRSNELPVDPSHADRRSSNGYRRRPT